MRDQRGVSLRTGPPLCDGVLRITFYSGGEPECFCGRDILDAHDFDHAELATDESAGFVEHDGIQESRFFQPAAVPYKHPLHAPRVVEMAMTTGIARPSAWGQEITSVVTSRSTAKAGSASMSVHTMNVSAPATRAVMVSRGPGQPAVRLPRPRLA